MKDIIWVFRSFGIKAGLKFFVDTTVRYIRHVITREKFPRCSECGGMIEMVGKPGRTREIKRGVHITIPSSCMIPTCLECGEEAMIPEVSEVLDRLLMEHIDSDKPKTLH